ncbi:MAG: DsbA family protein [Pelagibacterales bacterium]|nr:DsbA family protein [Pelagibacterales bacterium]
MKNSRKISIILISLCLLIGFFALVINNYKNKTSLKETEAQQVENENTEQNSQDKVSEAVNQESQSPETQVIKNSELLKPLSSDIILGDKSAPVVIIEYSSLSCPHCAAFHRESFDKIKNEYISTKKVQFIHRDFPLNQSALAASMLASCQAEGNPEKYYMLLKALFKTQDSWAFDQKFLEKLQSIAQLDGMSSEKFNSCVNNQKLQETILNHRIETSKSLELKSTPTFFINGETLEGYTDYVTIKNLIDKKLSQN